MMRIGAVPYLNGKPLIWGLGERPGVELICDVPSKLANMLQIGELAAGLVSSAACFQNPSLEILPGIGISSKGVCESVKLFYKGRIRDISSVALDTSSVTSVLLAKIILTERYGLEPFFVDMPPELDVMLSHCDAAVTIGDNTMCAPEGVWRELDLGAEWHELTGLPFVFAVWAVNPALASDELQDILTEAKARGQQSLEEISEVESRRLNLPERRCLSYLREIMNYDLTDAHIEGIRLFQTKVHEFGHIGEINPLKLWKPRMCKA